MYKKFVLAGFASAFALATISGVAARPEKAVVCHHTGNEANPWVVISASQNAVDQHIKRHAGDLVPEGESCENPVQPA